jgi:hypothetical protein
VQDAWLRSIGVNGDIMLLSAKKSNLHALAGTPESSAESCMVPIVSNVVIVTIAEDVTDAINSGQKWLSRRWSIRN